jgi:hypothetical protein
MIRTSVPHDGSHRLHYSVIEAAWLLDLTYVHGLRVLFAGEVSLIFDRRALFGPDFSRRRRETMNISHVEKVMHRGNGSVVLSR